ncbi:MAG: aminotransferase class IV [Acidobacteria bacterium]|nr:aminotransferase class IV [Acidobacteriota bacterium]
MLELVAHTRLDLARSAARHGRGLFETIRVEEGRPLRLPLHLERMARGCAFLEMDEPPETAAVASWLEAHTPCRHLALGVLRLVALDDRLLAWAEPLEPGPAGAVEVGLARSLARFSRSPLNRHKTLSYLENALLAREAEARGLYEVLALNEAGGLTDGSRCNVLLVRGNQVLTPPVEAGALPGTLRALLLAAGGVQEAPLDAGDLAGAEALLLCNALRELIPVATLEGRGGLDPDPPALARLRAAVAAAKG